MIAPGSCAWWLSTFDLGEGMYSRFQPSLERGVGSCFNQALGWTCAVFVIVDTDIGYKSADNSVYEYFGVDIFFTARGFGVYIS